MPPRARRPTTCVIRDDSRRTHELTGRVKHVTDPKLSIILFSLSSGDDSGTSGLRPRENRRRLASVGVVYIPHTNRRQPHADTIRRPPTMVGALPKVPARLPASCDFRSLQKQLVELTGPPPELRGGGVKAGAHREPEALPGWSRTKASGVAARSRPVTATPGGDRNQTPLATRGSEWAGEPRRARSSTPSLMLRHDAAPMLAGAAGPALRPSDRPRQPARGDSAQRPGRAEEVPREGVHTMTGVGGEEGSSVIRKALAQAESDERLLAQGSRGDGGDRMRQVQAALLREGSREALLLLRAERGQILDEVSRVKAKLKDMAAVQRHLQQTIEKQELQKISLLADRELVQRQVDSVQDSMQDVLAKAEQTMQLLHAHEQRVSQQARAQVTTAKDRAVEQEVKLSAQNMVAESLSNRVMQLTGERDTANATVKQQEKQIAHLTAELELRQSIDDVRYEHECRVQEISLKNRGKKELLINKWSADKLMGQCNDAFNQWHRFTRTQHVASLHDTIRSKYFACPFLLLFKFIAFVYSRRCFFACSHSCISDCA